MTDPDQTLQDEPVREALAELDDTGVHYRILDRDVIVFGDDPGRQSEAAQRLGWLDVTDDLDARVARAREVAEGVRAAGLDRVVLAGMGGSSLAPEVLATTFGASGFTVLDSTHPEAVAAAVARDLSDTVVVVSSKSGTTTETRCFGAAAIPYAPDLSHFVAITDPRSELAIDAESEGWRDTVLNPPDIGGRYAALSHVGMVPAALMGLDVAQLWSRADAELDRVGPGADVLHGSLNSPDTNQATLLAAFIGGYARAGRDKLTLLPAPGLESFGDWVEQLVAESLGKQGRGVVPVVGEPVGDPGRYGDDRAFVELTLDGRRAQGAHELGAAGHPVLSLDLDDRFDLAAQFLRWELAVAMVGVLLDVNPFDQPNVAESKANTNEVLEAVQRGDRLEAPADDDPVALLSQVGDGDYVSLQAYLPPTSATLEGLRRLQGLVRDRLRVAATAGVGPRFLHSTGQLHKGGPRSVVALQLVDRRLWGDELPQVPIPGRPFNFRQLISAQALGDLRSLRGHDRRVAQVGVDGPDGLAAVIDRLDDGLSNR